MATDGIKMLNLAVYYIILTFVFFGVLINRIVSNIARC